MYHGSDSDDDSIINRLFRDSVFAKTHVRYLDKDSYLMTRPALLNPKSQGCYIPRAMANEMGLVWSEEGNSIFFEIQVGGTWIPVNGGRKVPVLWNDNFDLFSERRVILGQEIMNNTRNMNVVLEEDEEQEDEQEEEEEEEDKDIGKEQEQEVDGKNKTEPTQDNSKE